ncbi:MAG: major capsid protein [Paracoccus sp. (in: a-proteobacteria)]|uniref:major capsid protein n=2 Tax=Paracoccaceae TaxID=31989 RepID=UPI0025EF6E18|nr:major capsid protein [Paracoccus sp. UBA889]|tara:strand:- start:3021 stop:4043 length:1023 start_codon:yes stop_codon:yes gene_type:complete
MTIIRNPFDADGYSLAEMTQAINILPNLYTRLGELGLFRFEGVSQRSVIIEQIEGVLNLLPSVPLGGPATVGSREGRAMRSFALPWIPHDDVILPADIQGVPAIGAIDEADPLVAVMTRKLTLMRRKHAQTREYMEMNALRGIVKDGAGTTLYNYFTEFGIAQISVDFVLGTAGTNIQGKVREVLRAVEDNLLGESMSGVHALVSREFFDKLISHPKTEEAYKFYAATGAQPLRQDVRRNFPFAGILFEEYAGAVTLSTKASERLVPANEGIAFPTGTMDTFTTYGGPANLLETANTIGLPLYARQHLDPKGRWIDLMTEASILPVNKRPRLAIRLHSSN